MTQFVNVIIYAVIKKNRLKPIAIILKKIEWKKMKMIYRLKLILNMM